MSALTFPHKRYSGLNLDMVAYPGYIRNIKNAPAPRVPFLPDADRTWGFAPLQMMLQRQERKRLQTGLIFVEISTKH